jgi:aminomethyltransferase
MTDDQASSPLELGLPVAWDKGPFVGRRALLAERDRGPANKLVGLVIDQGAYADAHTAIGLTTPYPFQAWRDQIPVRALGKQVGYATSGVWSPTLKQYIALAHVERALATPGQRLELELPVDRTRQPIPAVVSKRPFFNPARKKN